MHRVLALATALLTIGLIVAVALPGAEAKPSELPSFLVDGAFPAPALRDHEAISLWGELWANGENVGPYDFALLFGTDEGDPIVAQLWVIVDGVPGRICRGEIFDTPTGESILFGVTDVERPAGTCHMARVAAGQISLFVASTDGQWATAVLSGAAPGTDAARVF